MMPARQIILGLLILSVFCYLMQLCVIFIWRSNPIDSAESEGRRYSVHYGYGDASEFVPIRGLAPVIGSPVYLRVLDPATVELRKERYGDQITIYQKYSRVFHGRFWSDGGP